jgi:hypothetical protein
MPLAPTEQIDMDRAFNLWISTGLHYKDFWIGAGYQHHKDFGGLCTLGQLEWLPKLKSLIPKNNKCPPEWAMTRNAKPGTWVEPGEIQVPLKIEMVAVTPKESPFAALQASKLLPTATEETCVDYLYRRRTLQCPNDWHVGEMVKQCAERMIADSYQLVLNDSTGEYELKCTLSPSELRNLATTVREAQTIQRLALGLSSDNVATMVASSNLPQIVVSFAEPEKEKVLEIEASDVQQN